MKKAYLSNVLAMLGVAVVATAIFRDSWVMGTICGLVLLYFGYRLAKN